MLRGMLRLADHADASDPEEEGNTNVGKMGIIEQRIKRVLDESAILYSGRIIRPSLYRRKIMTRNSTSFSDCTYT